MYTNLNELISQLIVEYPNFKVFLVTLNQMF